MGYVIYCAPFHLKQKGLSCDTQFFEVMKPANITVSLVSGKHSDYAYRIMNESSLHTYLNWHNCCVSYGGMVTGLKSRAS